MIKFEKTYGFETTFTVKELKELLSKYEDTDLVNVYGGEDGGGEFCGIIVADSEDDLC